MRAARVVTLDGPSALQTLDIDEPVAGPGQIVIDVAAAGVSFPDVLLSRGLYQYKPEPPFTPGSEVSGIVRTAPEGSGFSAGDRVAAFSMAGSFQQVVAVDPAFVFPLPDGYDLDAAAGLPMNYLTVEFALKRRGHLEAGQTLLVHGAAGGVGTAGIQLAKALGATVIAVTSAPAKAEVAKQAGADHTVDPATFLKEVKELTDNRGVNLILDPVGGDRFTDSLRSLAPEGRLLVVGFVGGDIPTVKVNRLLLNNIDVVGVGWGAFALGRPELMREAWDSLLPHLASGVLVPPISSVFPLEETGAALAALEDRTATGKVLIKLR